MRGAAGGQLVDADIRCVPVAVCAWQGSLAAAGLCMLVLGGVALFGIHKNSWLILLVVECCNGALLLLIIVRRPDKRLLASRSRAGHPTHCRCSRRSVRSLALCSARAAVTIRVRRRTSCSCRSFLLRARRR